MSPKYSIVSLTTSSQQRPTTTLKKFSMLVLFHPQAIRDAILESEKSLLGGSGVVTNSKAIKKAGKKGKKYTDAQGSWICIHFSPNSGSSTKYSPARPYRVDLLKSLWMNPMKPTSVTQKILRRIVWIAFVWKRFGVCESKLRSTSRNCAIFGK